MKYAVALGYGPMYDLFHSDSQHFIIVLFVSTPYSSIVSLVSVSCSRSATTREVCSLSVPRFTGAAQYSGSVIQFRRVWRHAITDLLTLQA